MKILHVKMPVLPRLYTLNSSVIMWLLLCCVLSIYPYCYAKPKPLHEETHLGEAVLVETVQDLHTNNSSEVEDKISTVDPVVVAEKYVLAADFDNRVVAQISTSTGSSPDLTFEPPSSSSRIVKEDKNDLDEGIFKPPSNIHHWPHYHPSGYALAPYPDQHEHVDRDAFVPQGPAPILVSQRSVLAVGFISFLILLASLQNSMLNMAVSRRPAGAASTSLLGGVTQVLGRRRRRSAGVTQVLGRRRRRSAKR